MGMLEKLYVPREKSSWRGAGPKVDFERCRVECYNSVSRDFYQCARKKAVEVDGIGYCTQHSPQKAAERKAAVFARDEERRRKAERQWTRPAEYREALRAIANGHNDPRQIARDTLAKWSDI